MNKTHLVTLDADDFGGLLGKEIWDGILEAFELPPSTETVSVSMNLRGE